MKKVLPLFFMRRRRQFVQISKLIFVYIKYCILQLAAFGFIMEAKKENVQRKPHPASANGGGRMRLSAFREIGKGAVLFCIRQTGNH